MQVSLQTTARNPISYRGCVMMWSVLVLFLASASQADEAKFESRTWTDRQGNQLTSTFVDAKNGEVQLKNEAGEIQKFKLTDFSEPDQKYLRDLAVYRRKLAAGEKPQLPADPALASLVIQPRQTNTEPVPSMAPARKPLLEFPVRVWSDSAGKKVQGKLVTAYHDKVVIDVKGNAFDLPVTRLSSEDQAYVAVQLKGLQRDDLVDALAKATTPGQASPDAVSVPATTPMPSTVAANNPAPSVPSNTDDIHARLAKLRAQAQGDVPPAQVVANQPTQPAGTDDIQARLAQIRQEQGRPAAAPLPSSVPAASSAADDALVRLDANAQQAQENFHRQREEMQRQQQEMQNSITTQMSAPTPAPASSTDSSSESGGSFRIRRINIGFFIAVGAAIVGGIARLFGKR